MADSEAGGAHKKSLLSRINSARKISKIKSKIGRAAGTAAAKSGFIIENPAAFCKGDFQAVSSGVFLKIVTFL